MFFKGMGGDVEDLHEAEGEVETGIGAVTARRCEHRAKALSRYLHNEHQYCSQLYSIIKRKKAQREEIRERAIYSTLVRKVAETARPAMS